MVLYPRTPMKKVMNSQEVERDQVEEKKTDSEQAQQLEQGGRRKEMGTIQKQNKTE